MKKEKEREKDWGDLSSNKALTGLKLTSSAQSRFDWDTACDDGSHILGNPTRLFERLIMTNRQPIWKNGPQARILELWTIFFCFDLHFVIGRMGYYKGPCALFTPSICTVTSDRPWNFWKRKSICLVCVWDEKKKKKLYTKSYHEMVARE